MASMRDIKRKIKSVSSTQQITKAMNLVAASKLQRAKTKLNSTKPFFEETMRVISSIAGNSKSIRHPLLNEREVKNTLVILMAGDKGLCGGYNTNVCRHAHELVREKRVNSKCSLITVGSKARDYAIRRKMKIRNVFTGISENPFYEDATEIAHIVMNLFENGTVDEVYLVYTEFKSTISHEPKTVKLLPLPVSEEAENEKKDGGISAVMTYEPDETIILDYVIPKYVNTVVFGGLVESAACEQGARMTSMDNASKNADDMISKYTLQYNRARQGAITQEITEIVSGANALE